MAICRKSVLEISVAILGLTLVIVSALLMFIGMGRYYWGLEDDSFNNRNHFILSSNILTVFALAASLYILFDSGDQGVVGVVLMMIMLFDLIITLYLSNYDPSDKASNVISMSITGIDLYVKVLAILIGFGTCNTGDLANGISGVGRAIVGGRRR